MEFKLEYILNDELKTFFLKKETITIGKLSGNDMQLPDSSVSRNHCKLVKTDGGYKVIDLGSTNGTYVNGKRSGEKKLEIGDNITVGRTIIKFLEAAIQNTYTDVDDQKISMVIPLSDKILIKEEKKLETAKLSFLTALTALGKELIACTSLEESFAKVGKLIFEFLNPKRLYVFFYDASQENLSLKYSSTSKGKVDEPVNISRTVAMKAIHEKVAILSANTQDDARFDGAKSIIMYGITSAISVPIWTKTSIYGLIYADTTEFDKMFQQNDVEMLSVIANYVGLAVEGINSLEKLNREKKIRERLERYHSPAVVSRIMGSHNTSTMEMNAYRETEATVLFMDIVRFTTRVEKKSPVEIGVFLNHLFTEMTEIIFSHNGTLDKYIGDCIMAVFGVPFEMKDHAYVAIQTALHMMERLKEMNEQLSEQEDMVQVRIGINSGKLVAGDFGSPKRLDYTVIGNTVNIASRLEGRADTNEILISEATYALTRDRFECQCKGEQQLKGISAPVIAYNVLREKVTK